MKNTECEVNTVKYFTARVSNTPADPDIRVRQNNYLLALATLPRFQLYEGQYLSHVESRQVAPPDWKLLPRKVRRPGRWQEPEEANIRLWEEHGGWSIGKGPKVHIIDYEEKGSDVNVAVQMLNDAWAGEIECAVLVSNDSDLAQACKLVRDRGVKVGLITKAPRPTDRLSSNSDFHRHIVRGHIRGSQLPNEVVRNNGQLLSKPPGW